MQRGFTYVEMILSVIITGILMSALMGVVNTATETSDAVRERNGAFEVRPRTVAITESPGQASTVGHRFGLGTRRLGRLRQRHGLREVFFALLRTAREVRQRPANDPHACADYVAHRRSRVCERRVQHG